MTSRRKAVIVAWEGGHNPLGRAHVFHQLLKADWDTEIIAPLWSAWGTEVWFPLRDEGLPLTTFTAGNYEDFIVEAYRIALQLSDADLVVISKPRLPSLHLGQMIANTSGAKVIVDIDDDELSFYPEDEVGRFSALADSELRWHIDPKEPYGVAGTVLADRLVRKYPTITVSNPVLQQRFGGTIIRHARETAPYEAARSHRQESRRKQGIDDDELAVFFIGTPRPHKGIRPLVEVLGGLERNARLHIIGEPAEGDFKQWMTAQSDQGLLAWSSGCRFRELPTLLCAADAVVLLQDPGDRSAQGQVPAKISDAAALGIPVFASPLPALADLAEMGVVRCIEPQGLGEALDDLPRHAAPAAEAFAGSLSVSNVGEVLSSVIDGAVPYRFDLDASARAMLSRQEAEPARGPSPARISNFRSVMVFLDEQPMSAESVTALLQAGIRQLVTFGPPRSADSLVDESAASLLAVTRHQLGLGHNNQVSQSTFIWSASQVRSPLTGETFPTRSLYPDWVEAMSVAASVDPSQCLSIAVGEADDPSTSTERRRAGSPDKAELLQLTAS